MLNATDDVRIDNLRPLLPPAILMEELPLAEECAELVASTRKKVGDIVSGRDDRIVVVVGPCSVHDPKAAVEYAGRLKAIREKLSEDLEIVMRVYFEKPRTTVGWKGLINDPQLDGSFNINAGLRQARSLLREIVEMGVPAGTEFLDPITPQFIADLVSWGAIGARTTESQVHRELASGLSMPVGFKNGTGGSIQIAVDAVNAARHPHRFLSVTKQGLDVSRIHMIASTQVCDSVPETVGGQLRIEAFEPDVELRCSPPPLFKGELLQQVHNPLWQRNGPDRSLVLCGAYCDLHRAAL